MSTIAAKVARVRANEILSFVPHCSYEESYAKGRALRDKCPRKSHAQWKPWHDRPDPVALVEQSDEGRLPELIPVRHGRMMLSPFTFYRGTALNMAVDLAHLPTTGIRVQCCGDAHLGNFRGFATPERRVIFDIHDLDETLPAFWEWDLKRLAASFVIASRHNGFTEESGRDAVLTCVRSYRDHMYEYGKMGFLEVWYSRLDAEELVANLHEADTRRRVRRRIKKERSALEHDFPRLVHSKGKQLLIKENPPTIYHLKEHRHVVSPADVKEAFSKYRDSLLHNVRFLVDRFELKDIAIKVVGLGSVGTLCSVMLLMAGGREPLFLQVKQARESVLEVYAGRSIFPNHGERVVNGHRLMQSASDIFLGWTVGRHGDHLYIRQLRDAKIKPIIENFTPAFMVQFAEWCGHTLARAHARSGEPAVISGYLGNSDTFDKAIADFSAAYADQMEQDHKALVTAVRGGKLEVLIER